ncbi:hypothetical protein AMAG_06743 [Allomyces macrogynus ATCC 38327]|uniref:T-complex protein 1 subunit eta n=1 Tax=Allomyces macrogynus (strain ATCC 38327) TaxID=578462 RepID=A0A0L0SF37_ALLM3|nr:hypothetical protein AMAG_06743 [Allomyces macrogynus ATCC 38327]|eukprot:KNE60980.1 hypothetical protein AMAG_06743 [Allomyces macrogynus ATCC 38327]
MAFHRSPTILASSENPSLRSLSTVTISNDGATILKLLDIVHPAAKTLVDIARAQDAEVGDGTTSVVLLAGEVLKQVKPLIEEGVNPQTIIKGLRRASVLAVAHIRDLAVALDARKEDLRSLLKKCAATAMSSKIIHSYEAFFTDMVVDAVLRLDQADSLNEALIGMKRVPGGGVQDSFLVDGVAFKKTFSRSPLAAVAATSAAARMGVTASAGGAGSGAGAAADRASISAAAAVAVARCKSVAAPEPRERLAGWSEAVRWSLVRRRTRVRAVVDAEGGSAGGGGGMVVDGAAGDVIGVLAGSRSRSRPAAWVGAGGAGHRGKRARGAWSVASTWEGESKLARSHQRTVPVARLGSGGHCD